MLLRNGSQTNSENRAPLSMAASREASVRFLHKGYSFAHEIDSSRNRQFPEALDCGVTEACELRLVEN